MSESSWDNISRLYKTLSCYRKFTMIESRLAVTTMQELDIDLNTRPRLHGDNLNHNNLSNEVLSRNLNPKRSTHRPAIFNYHNRNQIQTFEVIHLLGHIRCSCAKLVYWYLERFGHVRGREMTDTINKVIMHSRWTSGT